MPQDTGKTSQSESVNHENEKPQAAPTNADQNSSSNKDDEDFVDIEHEDVDMQDSDHDRDSSNELGLQRFGVNVTDTVDDDDSDDEPDHMASHPLLSMLSGRMGQRRRGSNHKWDTLHPVTQVLSPANVDDCTELEESSFPEHERCTREKFDYRLSRCPELSLGLFSRPTEAECKGQSQPPKRRLIGHVVATRTPSPSVTDASMSLPSNWKTRKSSLPGPSDEEPKGHQEMGGTVCVHSVAIAKEHRNMGLGTILMKAYSQRIKDSKCADRIALLAHEDLIDFYTTLGFENMGPSSAQFGGGGWHNMIMEFTGDDDE